MKIIDLELITPIGTFRIQKTPAYSNMSDSDLANLESTWLSYLEGNGSMPIAFQGAFDSNYSLVMPTSVRQNSVLKIVTLPS